MKIFILAGCFLLTCTGAPHPQYGGVQPPQSEQPQPASQGLQPLNTVQAQRPPRRSEPHTLPVQASSVRCHVEAATVWDVVYTETVNNVCNTEYEEECTTAYQTQCRTATRKECNNVLEEVCTTNTRKECHQEFKTVYEQYVETECRREYKEDCRYHWEGEGNEKHWVVDEGTCVSNPYDKCEDVEKVEEKQVAYPVCVDVEEESCEDVPREVCRQVPHEVCNNLPYRKCEQVPREKCHEEHKKIPNRVSRSINKKVCDDGDTGSDGQSSVVEVKREKLRDQNEPVDDDLIENEVNTGDNGVNVGQVYDDEVKVNLRSGAIVFGAGKK